MIGTVSESNYPKATLYKNTGFNSVNVPKNWSVLRSAAQSVKDFPIMELTQILFLDSIRIKVNSEFDVAGVDYVELTTQSNIFGYHAFYSCNKYRMLAPDVAELYLIQDSWMTVGGLDGIASCLDGMATRSNKASNGNVNVVEDPMLIPHFPIVAFVGDGGDFDKGIVFASANNVGIYVSTVDLKDMSQHSAPGAILNSQSVYDFITKSITPTTGTDPVVLSTPYIRTNAGGTSQLGEVSTPIEMAQGDYANFPNNIQIADFSGVYFIAENVTGALSALRSFGLTDVIVASYQPMMCHYDTDGGGGVNYKCTKMYGESGSVLAADKIEYRIDYTGSIGYQNAVPVSVNHNPKYIKSLLGKYNKYVLISPATGNSREVLPEDLDIADIASPNYRYAGPVLYYASDPRPEGCPYFNIRTKDGVNMYQNAVQGAKWANNPIVFERPNGEAISQMMFKNEQEWKDHESSVAWQDTTESNGIGGFIGNTIGRSIKTAITGALNMIGGMPSTPEVDLALMGDKSYQAQLKRNLEAVKERQQYAIQHAVSVPEVRFGFSGTLRDAIGNGAMLVKFGLDPRDIELFDKIQEQFGVSCYEPLRTGMLDPGDDPYAYVEAKGASFNLKKRTGQSQYDICNKDVLDDISSMFSTGIRIWNVKPSASYYDPYRNA